MTHLNTSPQTNHIKVYYRWLIYHSHQPRFMKIKDKNCDLGKVKIAVTETERMTTKTKANSNKDSCGYARI